jgi:hypothetical protein
MKITIEHHEEKFTYESKHDSIDMSALTDQLYGLCISAGYHPDIVGECFFEKGREMTEHLYSNDNADHDDDNSMIDWMKEKDIHSGVYEPDLYESIVVKSRYGDERKFTMIAKNCIEYSFEDVEHVGCSRNDDGAFHHVDPSGGPYIAIGTMLGNIHKDLEGLTVTKIKADENEPGVYYLTVK